MRPLLAYLLSLPLFAEAPPEGFRALFNGQDLSGWHGHNPHQGLKPVSYTHLTLPTNREV